MVQVKREFTVDRPMDTVVGYLRDFSTTEAWDPGTKTCRRTDTGEIRVGSTWHNTSQFRGKEVELHYRLETLEADHLVFRGEAKTAAAVDNLRFSPVGDSTRITYEATISFKGLLRLADPFVKSGFEKVADETVEQMTSTLNSLNDGG